MSELVCGSNIAYLRHKCIINSKNIVHYKFRISFITFLNFLFYIMLLLFENSSLSLWDTDIAQIRCRIVTEFLWTPYTSWKHISIALWFTVSFVSIIYLCWISFPYNLLFSSINKCQNLWSTVVARFHHKIAIESQEIHCEFWKRHLPQVPCQFCHIFRCLCQFAWSIIHQVSRFHES